MQNNFAAQYAPDVALPAYEWATPDTGQEAGLDTPENLYDENGNPYNYMQVEGGQRQFLVPQGATAFRQAPGNSALQEEVQLRGRTREPVYGLRGRTPDATDGIRGRMPQTVEPQDLMRRQPQAGLDPIGQLQQQLNPPSPPVARLRVPGVDETVTNAAIDQRRTEDRVSGAAIDERARQGALNTPGSIQDQFNAGTAGGLGTLQRLLEDQGFDLSGLLDRLRGHAPAGPSSSDRGASGASMESPLRLRGQTIDTDPNMDSRITPVSANYGNATVNNTQGFVGRATEIEQLLRQNGVRLTRGAGVRNRNAVRGGHPEGNSVDVPPNELENAVRIIRADPRFANIPMQPIYIRRGQRFPGGVVATGNHYHIDLGPAAQR